MKAKRVSLIILTLVTTALLASCTDTRESEGRDKDGLFKENEPLTKEEEEAKKQLEYNDLTDYSEGKPNNIPPISVVVASEIEDFKYTPFVLATNGKINNLETYKVATGQPLKLNDMTLTVTNRGHVKALEGYSPSNLGFYRYKVTLTNKTGKTFKGSWLTLLSFRSNGYLHAPVMNTNSKKYVLTIHNGQTKSYELYFAKSSEKDNLSDIVFHNPDKSIQVQWAKENEKVEPYEEITKSVLIENGYKIEVDLADSELFKYVAPQPKPKPVKQETVKRGTPEEETGTTPSQPTQTETPPTTETPPEQEGQVEEIEQAETETPHEQESQVEEIEQAETETTVVEDQQSTDTP